MNADDHKNNSGIYDGKPSPSEQEPKSPAALGKSLVETVGLPLKRGTRKLPARMKCLGPGIVDVTDRHIGKSIIIGFSALNKPAESEEQKQAPKKRPEEP